MLTAAQKTPVGGRKRAGGDAGTRCFNYPVFLVKFLGFSD